jgi:hypothetical protein
MGPSTIRERRLRALVVELGLLGFLALIPERSAVDAAYLAVGVALVALPWAPSLSAHQRSGRLEAQGSS